MAGCLAETDLSEGLLILLCRHTSASLLIQENAAREVRTDLATWLDRLALEGSHYAHDGEGPDDKPAHLKAVLTLQIPVLGGSMALGTRSEEHTSELQSLMRISYAVFCLKKKKPQHHRKKYNDHIQIKNTSNYSHTIEHSHK